MTGNPAMNLPTGIPIRATPITPRINNTISSLRALTMLSPENTFPAVLPAPPLMSEPSFAAFF